MSDAAIGALRSSPQPIVYPQRADPAETWLDRIETAITSVPARGLTPWWRLRFGRIAASIEARSAIVSAMRDADLRGEADAVREQMMLHGHRADLVVRAFALIREVSARTIGLSHYPTQLMGGLALLKGMVAEMETGEGKTLTATLAAGTAALAGSPVHIITVNDYLAQRDAEIMAPIYQWLGLKVGTVVAGITPDQRRQAYAREITYCCNKEVAFDYLRDRLVLGRMPGNIHLKLERLGGGPSRCDRLVMRGLPFAIIDEVDSVLIDEARTPLIISGETPPEDERRWTEEAMGLASSLQPPQDYRIHAEERRIELTKAGRQKLSELGEALGEEWHSRIRREESARQALSALHLFQRDEHYLVRDGKVQIIDEYTGRIMADRTWSDGLHQLVEAKEGCPITGRKVTLARTSYQRFFRRYKRVAGMTGTASEVAGELWAVYRLAVVPMPTFRPLQRRRHAGRTCPTLESKWEAIVERVRALQAEGRPVLIGTRSVAASEILSQRLQAGAMEHVVLSAAQDSDEAGVVARAGGAGCVTVATNMAGRGVDIKLADGVAERGGLHVILSERHDAGRIDRQLAGRCGRQGDPGSYEFILSLEDPLLELASTPLRQMLAATPGPLRQVLAPLVLSRAQRRAERAHSRMRRDLLRSDQQLGTVLAFTGESE
jgi:preprotein translocase subunit SecA